MATAHRPPTDILVTHEAWARHHPQLTLAGPEASWLVMAQDGGLRRPGDEAAPIRAEEAAPTVAWITSDLFDRGAPIRPFFGLVRRASSLAWVQSSSAGVDSPFFAELVGRGVRLTNSHIYGGPIAEYVLWAVLDHYQGAGEWRAAQIDRQWRLHDFREVEGTTWLVIGYGDIGRAVGVRARAFGAKVIGVRRRPAGDEPADRMVTGDQVPEVLAEADVVVLAAPATPETTGMVDDAFLTAMRPGSVLVNIARGSLVDEEALLAGLDRGIPEAALLDVFGQEPLPPAHPFWSHPRVRVTPHNSGVSSGRFERAAAVFTANLERWQAGAPLEGEVTPADLGPG